jgi:hypothetical protein
LKSDKGDATINAAHVIKNLIKMKSLKNQKMEVIVEPHELLKEDMALIKGGVSMYDCFKCRDFKCKDGEVNPKLNAFEFKKNRIEVIIMDYLFLS